MNKQDRHDIICSYNNYNSILLTLGNKISCSWLVDTGASLSAIQYETLHQNNIPFQKGNVTINGVCGELCSIGFVDLTLSYKDVEFVHRFHVFRELCCKSDGILGLDFLKKYYAKLDLELDILTLLNNNTEISLPLQPSVRGGKFINLLPRCESLHFISTSLKDECVVLPKQLCEGVFMAGCIAKPKNGRIPIKILNIREEPIGLSFFCPEIENLKDYSLLSFDKANINADRVKRLFNELKLSYLNKEEQLEIEKICAKFSDVFH